MKRLFYILIILAGHILTCWAQWGDPVLIDSPYDTLGININQKEWCPFITADGQHLYFASERRWNNDLYVCHWDSTHWSRPQMIPFCSPDGDERNPSVNPTNDTLYFISYGGVGGWDIFWSFRNGPCDTCWGEPERMPESINSNGIEFSVWATPDNQRLLFSSWRIAANNEDIYECRRDASTPTGWSDPHPLDGQLNTWNIESYPSMGLDTTELYFWGRYSFLYVSHLTESGWTRGDSLPSNINRVIISFPSETTPCITADGHRLYFSSRWGDPVTSSAIWYTEPISSVPQGRDNRNTQQGSLLNVFPNPARGEITIRMTGGLKRAVLFDLLGRTVAAKTFSIGTEPVRWNPGNNERALTSGIYFLVGESRTATETVQIHLIK